MLTGQISRRQGSGGRGQETAAGQGRELGADAELRNSGGIWKEVSEIMELVES
jgi:hypothetical protein